ncbi:single-stranded-DNA-specific exonuclease [Methylomarinovum caldicuralii]|uniref:Single-stranded-DNA-specific exonuclease RecJ n=1 Tax=Methylomarinovum caldicuralii TaxID=438856 RepID=A0AAU9C1J5_9GAMM|nr:single-stranded-DNA-specific exonuclease RecJ [Methylomarinovum caldicuralii]BCX82585.1 single-stranded-DNA-specific exonuclease [Methylomarinovum caldicuralii]
MRKRRLRLRPLPDEPHDLPSHLHPVLKRIYLARGIRRAEELAYTLKRLPPPGTLSGIETLTARLAAAIERDEAILVVADYDADGATACALAVSGLRALGARRVDFIVPDRFKLGYGLTPGLVREALARRPDVLLTVDNGIASLQGVAAAKEAELDVLITDHHLPGEALPEADAIVNPNLPEDAFPGKALAGVGVMFYVLIALRAELRARGRAAEVNLADWLDLVALGTVADVVPLDTVNRILVHQGLERMRRGRLRPGIRALLEAAGRSLADLVTSDLAFAAGPRLNAAGRLEDMTVGIRCLLSDDPNAARRLAARLDALNRERRDIEAQMQAEALQILDSRDWDGGNAAICLYDPGWHEGVVGILASRIKDRTGRPVIAFAPGEDGLLKGSARSVPGLHIRDVLAAIDAARPGLIARYGGHAMAAGLSLAPEHLDRFAAAFEAQVAAAGIAADEILATDGTLAPPQFSLELAETLRRAGPWGQAFPEPLFHGDFAVCQARIVGERHLKLTVVPPAGPALDAIAFNLDDPAAWLECAQLRLAYQLDVNEFRGRRSVQLKVDYLEPL